MLVPQCSLPMILHPQQGRQTILFLSITSSQVAVTAQPHVIHSMSDVCWKIVHLQVQLLQKMGSLLLTALCLSVILLVMLTAYQLSLRQNLSLRSLFCGSHPSRKTRKKGIPSVMNAFVTILSCVCLLRCLPHSSASPFNEIPPPDLECNTVEFVDVDNTACVAHHPMSKSRLSVVYRKCLPEEIQQSMVQMDASRDVSWYRLVTQEKMLM